MDTESAVAAYPTDVPAPIYVAKYVFRFPNTPSAAGPVTSIREVEFMPFGKHTAVPGFTHRVLIDGLMKDWLGYGKPSARSAEYFLRKHWSD